jgi:hypothetical protein
MDEDEVESTDESADSGDPETIIIVSAPKRTTKDEHSQTYGKLLCRFERKI